MEKLFSDLLLKNQKWAYLWINSLKFLQFFLMVCEVEDYRNILKLSCRPLAFASYETSLKISLPTLFSAWFLKKDIFLAIFYYLTKSHCLVALSSWDFGEYMYCNCLLTRFWRYNFFEINLIFLIKLFFKGLKIQDKNLSIYWTKKALEMK